MTLVAFLQAQNCSNYAGLVAASASMSGLPHRRTTTSASRARSRTGKFHLAFFDDRLAMPDRYGDDHAESVRHGIRVVKLDLIPCSPRWGWPRASRRRRHLLDDLLRAVSRRPRLRDARPHDRRPRGLERRHLAQRLRGGQLRPRASISSTTCATTAPTSSWKWSSATGTRWEDDALILDRRAAASPIPRRSTGSTTTASSSARAARFTVPRSPQGHPVLIQAGQSGRGRRFAARWGELIFVIYPSLEVGRQALRASSRTRSPRPGATRRSVRIAPAVY